MLKLELELKKLNAEKFELINKNLSTNLTTQVYLRSFYVLFKSIKEYPLGWGANNYNLASKNYRFDIPYINPDTIFLNSEDASNNFVKFITEFGIFGILILIFICIICLSSKIDYEVKLFFIPLIITQLIRGAGYYNGGFIFALNFLMILYIVNSKTYK